MMMFLKRYWRRAYGREALSVAVIDKTKGVTRLIVEDSESYVEVIVTETAGAFKVWREVIS